MTSIQHGALRLALHQTRYELLAFVRNRRARIFAIAVPVALLVLFVSMWGGAMVGSGADRAGLATYYVPGMAGLGVIGASFAAIAISTTIQRETGILKRRRSTPVPAWALLVGRALASVGLSLAMTALLSTLAPEPVARRGRGESTRPARPSGFASPPSSRDRPRTVRADRRDDRGLACGGSTRRLRNHPGRQPRDSNARRDRHRRSADYLDTEQYPGIRFETGEDGAPGDPERVAAPVQRGRSPS